MKRLCLIIAVWLLLLCGCDKGNKVALQETLSAEEQNAICGNWYAHPEIQDGTVEIRSDGTCLIWSQESNWTLDTVGEDYLILLVDGNYLTFSGLKSDIPYLYEEYIRCIFSGCAIVFLYG